MPDWTVRRRLPAPQPAWYILPEDAGGSLQHPFRQPEQDVVKWQNQMYAVTRRNRHTVVYVPVPLPPSTLIGLQSSSSSSDNEED